MLPVDRVRSTGLRAIGLAAALALLVLASGLAAGCSSPPDEATATPTVVPTVEPALPGRELFAANCAVCHGVSGEGQPDWQIRRPDGTLPAPPLNGDGHTWHHPDGLLYRLVSQGGQLFEDPLVPGFKSAMPAFGGTLSHNEIVDVLTYIKSLWGEKTKRGLSIRESQALVSEQDPFPPRGG